MFWGHIIQQGTTLNLSQFTKKGDLLHLSHINLHPTTLEGNTTVFLLHEGKKYLLAHLNKNFNSVTVDLYFATKNGPVFSVQGNGQVSLLGYFPPSK
jgi:hypothetical protein